MPRSRVCSTAATTSSSEEVDRFETAFATACAASHAVGVASGTDAITIALLAAGVGAGDEVITAPNTCIPTIVGIERAGATPVLADVDPATYTLDPADVKRRLTLRTKAILPVHLYGQPADLESLLALAGEHDILLVEDCAQAHGATVGGVPVGSFGTASAFSFYPTKNLGALGDAGAVVTQSETIAAHTRLLRNYGERSRFEHVLRGLNSRLDPIQAAMLTAKLSGLAAGVERRRQLAAVYDKALADSAVTPPAVARGREHAYHLYVVLDARAGSVPSRADGGRSRHGGALSDAGTSSARLPRARQAGRLPGGGVALRAGREPPAFSVSHGRGNPAGRRRGARSSRLGIGSARQAERLSATRAP